MGRFVRYLITCYTKVMVILVVHSWNPTTQEFFHFWWLSDTDTRTAQQYLATVFTFGRNTFTPNKDIQSSPLIRVTKPNIIVVDELPSIRQPAGECQAESQSIHLVLYYWQNQSTIESKVAMFGMLGRFKSNSWDELSNVRVRLLNDQREYKVGCGIWMELKLSTFNNKRN
jgi:hypothetical protein